MSMFRKRLLYEGREKEKNRSRQLIMQLELQLPFALVDAARLLSASPVSPSPAKVSHHSLRMLPNICVRVCEHMGCVCVGGGGY